MIGRSALVVGLLLLGAWLLWSRLRPVDRGELVGRRLFAAGITFLFVGALLRVLVRA